MRVPLVLVLSRELCEAGDDRALQVGGVPLLLGRGGDVARASPRHVPAVIAQVADIPYTRGGKKVELAVREVLHGRPVGNLEAVANPQALEEFQGREDLRA